MLMSESLPVPAEPAAAGGEQLAGMLLGFVVSQAIYVAAVLGIADLLADGPRSVTALAAAAGADPDGLYRVLRLLAGHGIFTELPKGAVRQLGPQSAAAGDRARLAASPGPCGR
jgi:hypothetical protein